MKTGRCVVACPAGSLFALPCHAQQEMPLAQRQAVLDRAAEMGAESRRRIVIEMQEEEEWARFREGREWEEREQAEREQQGTLPPSQPPPPARPESDRCPDGSLRWSQRPFPPIRYRCPDGSYRASSESLCPRETQRTVLPEQLQNHCPDGSTPGFGVPCSLKRRH